MKEYIVSARKYRPMSFDSVVGQAALTTTLRNAVKSGKLAHAYLFCGPRGVGKTTCARIFAKAINCLSPTGEGEACNTCESCMAFNEQRSYNIFELDAASNNSVENIKALMEQTRIPPQVGKYKVFIIDEVHMLSTAAFNAFLKTLEEPPAHVIFILATTEKHKILPTIISRCQIYDFERMSAASIVSHLKMVAEKEGISCEEEALGVIAEKADGGMRDALSIFDQAASFCRGNITYDKVIEDLNVLDAENYFKVTDLCLKNDVSGVMILLNSVIAKGFDGGHFISGLAAHLRNVLMAKDESTLHLLEVSDRQRDRYKEQATTCPAKFLYRALKVMNECDINYRQSSNKRLLVELTLIQVAQITQPDDEGDSAGRSPKRRIKSLFRKLIADARQTAAIQVAATEQTATTKKPEAVSASSGTKRHDTHAETTAATSSAGTGSSPKAPAIKLGSIGKTFSNLKKKPERQSDTTETEIADTGERQEFDNDMLQMQWYAMCKRMPQQMAGLAARMKNIQPAISSLPDIDIVVDNKILLEEILRIKGRIRNTLAIALHNTGITLNIRQAKPEEIKKILSPRELLEEMSAGNKAIERLRKELELEIV
ncbi:DNA polymerase III subunit gamma/tau [Prevotella sp. PCHR]|uniref:DNA polymerase III subunit gamma/tau n=1 Tax=Xylanibacter caecicola TaxID=2736294 RepID=A0ABX2AZZ4_9BACT|nr:DNA polymerase III subunit gamma/tau [Xylanibacter caecicola]NPE24362.1 DNA polymerase III subunit gamma/tau [Xylanibacter caecicola]